LFIRRIKINHKSLGSCAFILEVSAAANSSLKLFQENFCSNRVEVPPPTIYPPFQTSQLVGEDLAPAGGGRCAQYFDHFPKNGLLPPNIVVDI
jgi:hypothetical protein